MPQPYLAGLVWLPMLLVATCGRPHAQDPDVLTLEVAPRTVECMGEAPQRCLLVRTAPGEEWTYFYDRIDGFAYEEGYEYRIQVSRRHVTDPPADASSFTYRLLRILSKEPAKPG